MEPTPRRKVALGLLLALLPTALGAWMGFRGQVLLAFLLTWALGGAFAVVSLVSLLLLLVPSRRAKASANLTVAVAGLAFVGVAPHLAAREGARRALAATFRLGDDLVARLEARRREKGAYPATLGELGFVTPPTVDRSGWSYTRPRDDCFSVGFSGPMGDVHEWSTGSLAWDDERGRAGCADRPSEP